jgi:hypothetical protein
MDMNENKTGLTFTSEKERGDMTPPVGKASASFNKMDLLNSFKDTPSN